MAIGSMILIGGTLVWLAWREEKGNVTVNPLVVGIGTIVLGALGLGYVIVKIGGVLHLF